MRIYPSIENDYKIEQERRYKRLANDDKEWIATEKIHGQNASIVMEDGKFEFHSRNKILIDNGEIIEDTNIAHRFNKVLSKFINDNEIKPTDEKTIIVGEVYSDTIFNMGYGEELQFKIFNVFKVNGTHYTIIPYDEIVEIYGKENVVPEIARGTFEELMNMEIPNDSLIGNGISEGMVIQPNYSYTFNRENGEFNAIKRKNEKFIEMNGIVQRRKRKNTKKTPRGLQGHIKAAVTMPRLESVISKGYDVNNVGEVITAMREDIAEELSDKYDYDEAFEVSKRVSNDIFTLLKEFKER